MNFFEHQNTIAKNLLLFIRERGYSKLSLSKLTGIPRPMIDKLLMSCVTDPVLYNKLVVRINESFDIPNNYLLTQSQIINTSQVSSHNSIESYRCPKTRDLFDGLDNLLDIYSLYVN
ncbi:hypothetical protein [Paenibacillus rigui]|uniref:hypothetical protein n=1 Tax=Paenibacillus rigui TaxID=554312 RepID=UPI00117DE14E|nr:hypothetical protein [Paenibacillus rigui]